MSLKQRLVNVLHGGAGDDQLYGDDGSDTYIFNRGDGQDTIYNYNNTNDIAAGKVDKVDLSAVNLNDVSITRQSDDLIISIKHTLDTLRIASYFSQDASDVYRVDLIQFADATLNVTAIKAIVLIATEDEDHLTGYAGQARNDGWGAANDTVWEVAA